MEWKLYLFIKKLYILNLLIGYILYIYEYMIKLIIFENYRKLSYILFVFMKNFTIYRERFNIDTPKF